MLSSALILAFVLVGAAFGLSFFRLLRGPSLPDRILALDTLYINSLAVLILVGIRFDTAVFFEAALVIAALGFVGTVALSKFVVRGNIVE